MKNVDQSDIINWINEAIKEKAKIVVICYDQENDNVGFVPHYLQEATLDEHAIKLINEDDERYSFRGIIDVQAEIQRGINEGLAQIDYQKAKLIFADLVL
ncbi:TPA: hypothetical protein DCZ39_09025 [Patescibacteria group bacterium]|nr:hypothetical protein [Candidatus Gracilibacteria bacterium]